MIDIPTVNIKKGMQCFYIDFQGKRIFPAHIVHIYSDYEWDVELKLSNGGYFIRHGMYNRDIFFKETTARNKLGIDNEDNDTFRTENIYSDNRSSSCGAIINHLYQCRCS